MTMWTRPTPRVRICCTRFWNSSSSTPGSPVQRTASHASITSGLRPSHINDQQHSHRYKEDAMPGKQDPGPSVKDDRMYEELRKEGNSKEKSARIANAAANSSL